MHYFSTRITQAPPIVLKTIYCTFQYVYISLDVNECSFNNGGCEHDCHNVPGSVQCRCTGGYRLRNDTKTCEGTPNKNNIKWSWLVGILTVEFEFTVS